MSWQERVDKHLTLTSPAGNLFLARWAGNKRSKHKKLGVLEYPLARGAVVQDLDIGPEEYDLTFWFDGPDHDRMAERFWQACAERGPWNIVHPVKGHRTLQLVKVREAIEPVTSGNITEFETEWIEPGVNNPEVSAAQIASNARSKVADVRDTAAGQAANVISVAPQGLGPAVHRLLARMAAVKATVMGVSARITEIRRGILMLMDGTVASTAGLAGAISNLITTPALIIDDLGARFDYYDKVLTDAFTTTDSTVDMPDAAVRELTVVSALTGMAESLIEAEFASRDEALGYLERLHASTLRAINGLDSLQDRFAAAPIDQRYFSQSESYHDLLDLMMQTRDLLLRRAFDLSVAKYITLTRGRAAIEIALTEGVDYDSFIAANKLRGDEILLLPAGRTVVVYL